MATQLAMLPSDKSSKHLDPLIYARACQDLINTQQSDAGIAARNIVPDDSNLLDSENQILAAQQQGIKCRLP